MNKTFLRLFWIVLFALITATIPLLAKDQDTSKQSRWDVRFTGGGLLFYLDEPLYSAFGGSVRYYLIPRLAVQIEILYASSSYSKILLGVPTILYHITSPKKEISLYAFAGMGGGQETLKYTGHKETKFELSIGLGIKSKGKIFFSLEGRVVGFTASIGYAFK